MSSILNLVGDNCKDGWSQFSLHRRSTGGGKGREGEEEEEENKRYFLALQREEEEEVVEEDVEKEEEEEEEEQGEARSMTCSLKLPRKKVNLYTEKVKKSMQCHFIVPREPYKSRFDFPESRVI